MDSENAPDNSWISRDVFKTMDKADERHYTIVGYCYDQRFLPAWQKEKTNPREHTLNTVIVFEDDDNNYYYDHIDDMTMHDWRQQLSNLLWLTIVNTERKFTAEEIDTSTEDSWGDYFNYLKHLKENHIKIV